MNSRVTVFLCGRDNVGWATDDDYFLTRGALSDFVHFVDAPDAAEIVHAVNWRALLAIPVELLRSRTVIAHVSHDVRAMLGQPDYLKVAPYVNRWIGPSQRAERLLSLLGLPTAHVPYVVDTSLFHPLPPEERKRLRARLGLPESAYLIGSFQRDTEGRDLLSPKLVKGPDTFFAIVGKLHTSGRHIHIVLAGPRRMWLKRMLAEAGIPFTFIGVECGAADDLKQNTLDQKTINELYNVVDLYIVASRLEGGPKAVLECAAAGTRIIAPTVGQVPDVLHASQIFHSLPEAVRLVEADMDTASLAHCVELGRAMAQAHCPRSVVPLWHAIYEGLASDHSLPPANFRQPQPASPPSWWRRALRRSLGAFACFDYVRFRDPLGSKQFPNTLSRALPRFGWRARFSRYARCEVVMLNSFRCGVTHCAMPGMRYVHGIDRPMVPVCDNCGDHDWQSCHQAARISVMPSEWSLIEAIDRGLHPVNPVLIYNAADPAIFYPARDRRPHAGRKLKLISTSSLENPKGGSVYQWLDDNLDWSQFEYTFVGRVDEPLRNIQVVPPVTSRKLARILRSHDIYITAGDDDPCFNALIEAMSCGLPAVYLGGSGYSELVSFGGLGFERPEEIPALLDAIAEDYDAFRRLAVAPNLGEIAQRYAECFDLVCGRL